VDVDDGNRTAVSQQGVKVFDSILLP
jgi:hypothetical protein